ncbi:WD-40 repeat-containing protein [Laetiporus sulphureus 93-53]|uniref:ASTRA-associated protein 1 n=1 Tax=Laetiporus sulphureus 93-53 TaxID=1314785 RepID=A0A165CDQ4_9APHY|nr:WD-40 repeat-containing protein [Laetiporus sulphureus 93-53]KZT02625.1 WD-40 repeat-containing protein [Laetiporus sulphureus 93-53]
MSSTKPPPPSPSHVLRTHAAAVCAIYFSDDNERLYSGDASGRVVITNTRTLRPSAVWDAHTDSILGIQEWEDHIITHGRDNKLHVWQRVQEFATALGNSAATPGLQTPQLCYSMDVNALNYCRFSLWPIPGAARDSERRALIALPNLVESSVADIWVLPSRQRLHAAVGKIGLPSSTLEGRGLNPIGIIMSLHLYEVEHPHVSGRKQLRLLCAYENGSVTMWGYTRLDKETSVEGIGWDSLWNVKLHVESVMAMAVSRDGSLALTVSADHLIGRYDLQAADGSSHLHTACVVHRTKHAGNGSIAIRDDGKVCAVGGWDGKIRLYSTKTMKPLGTLEYHKQLVQAVAFARLNSQVTSADALETNVEDDSEDGMTEQEKLERCRWLAAGGLDQRVSLWSLISFGKS